MLVFPSCLVKRAGFEPARLILSLPSLSHGA